MRHTSILLTSVTTAILLSVIRPSTAQIFGCEGDGINCPTSGGDGKGVCLGDLTENGIGTVSFESNITSDGPLSWTLTQIYRTASAPAYIERDFWIATPPALNLSEVSGFGGCSVVLRNMTAALQPSKDADFSNFGCGTVIGDSCAQDILQHVHQELIDIVQNGTLGSARNPCGAVVERLGGTPLPDSCTVPFRSQLFVTDKYLFVDPVVITGQSDFGAQSQDSCDITSGGPDYLIDLGSRETKFEDDGAESFELYKTGTTPVFAMFYNEPWNNASTGPVSFLEEPEVHLSCLTIVPSTEQSSGSSGRLLSGSNGWGFTLLIFVSLAWVSVVF